MNNTLRKMLLRSINEDDLAAVMENGERHCQDFNDRDVYTYTIEKNGQWLEIEVVVNENARHIVTAYVED